MFAKIFLLSLFIAVVAFYVNPEYLQQIFDFYNPQKTTNDTELLTPDDLKQHNGIDRPQLYLAILGKVFDVSKAPEHYGPGQSYNFFIGKDASRSFISGKFGPEAEHGSDLVSDLTPEELRSLNHWLKFYRKEYSQVGKLIGRYYGSDGKLTRYGREVRKLIKGAELEKESQDLDKIKFPPCNVEWDSVQGTRVWCSSRSGGIARDWIGVPRQMYEPGSKDYRCACINPQITDLGNVKEYEGCDSKSESCFVK